MITDGVLLSSARMGSTVAILFTQSKINALIAVQNNHLAKRLVDSSKTPTAASVNKYTCKRSKMKVKNVCIDRWKLRQAQEKGI